MSRFVDSDSDGGGLRGGMMISWFMTGYDFTKCGIGGGIFIFIIYSLGINSCNHYKNTPPEMGE